MQHLTANQRAYIYRQRTLWQARAAGKDERYNEYGTAPGRPAKPKATKTPAERDREIEESDPLVSSLLRKYGTRRDWEEV